ncbi:TPA: P2 family phage major capsid protein [Pseudomonas aeruginosa]|nr:P2 family phage major capsid protein [Pseudomonas aeruginosa]EKU9562307.1 P2 family phage major capsid protein [Pseudomonas aeruginosa]MBX5970583.1 P2 family phage major capsid protein [Pseudomonas aeruginosa]MBX6191014.1 P2 family phage major capsid protein [Pseudomonas aeruginosa]MBX6715342.1 P2 family phage major capsid protein [Pseudomonas aeruginosa]
MRNETRVAFNGYLGHVAKLNGVESAAVKFNVEPSIQQKLETAIQEGIAFLGRINVIGVIEQSGEALLLGVNGPIASRTNTAAGNRRNPGERQTVSKDVYTCKQTNFDSAFPYPLLDAWAKFPDFQVRLTNAQWQVLCGRPARQSRSPAVSAIRCAPLAGHQRCGDRGQEPRPGDVQRC